MAALWKLGAGIRSHRGGLVSSSGRTVEAWWARDAAPRRLGVVVRPHCGSLVPAITGTVELRCVIGECGRG
jgi:hypothetical protein